jgi:sirohydrochlorin ferrochelatase
MPPIAVILIDHGSRQGPSAAALDRVAQLAAERLRLAVDVAHLAIGQPTLDEAIGRAVARGSRRIIVCPYFLAAGTHTQGDIPALVAAAASRHAGLSIQVAEPLGPDLLLAELVARRIEPLLCDVEGV